MGVLGGVVIDGPERLGSERLDWVAMLASGGRWHDVQRGTDGLDTARILRVLLVAGGVSDETREEGSLGDRKRGSASWRTLVDVTRSRVEERDRGVQEHRRSASGRKRSL